MAENIGVESLEFIGEVKHVLSHRDIFVQVWLGICQQGIDPATVALSSLDRKDTRTRTGNCKEIR